MSLEKEEGEEEDTNGKKKSIDPLEKHPRKRLRKRVSENEVLKDDNDELGKDISPEEKTSQGWLQLQRENARLRDAILRLRDLTEEQQLLYPAQFTKWKKVNG